MMESIPQFVQSLIDGIIQREGDKFTDHPDDSGGPTRWGITEVVARADGYTGRMQDLPEERARLIYLRRYYTGPNFDRIAVLHEALAEEVTDTGVNMGQTVATVFLQRSLNALNKKGAMYSDIKVDGNIGDNTMVALSSYLKARGVVKGGDVLLKAINCLQGARYIELAEIAEKNESFVYGWLDNRIQL